MFATRGGVLFHCHISTCVGLRSTPGAVHLAREQLGAFIPSRDDGAPTFPSGPVCSLIDGVKKCSGRSRRQVHRSGGKLPHRDGVKVARAHRQGEKIAVEHGFTSWTPLSFCRNRGSSSCGTNRPLGEAAVKSSSQHDPLQDRGDRGRLRFSNRGAERTSEYLRSGLGRIVPLILSWPKAILCNEEVEQPSTSSHSLDHLCRRLSFTLRTRNGKGTQRFLPHLVSERTTITNCCPSERRIV
jgi:hypothetical protein